MKSQAVRYEGKTYRYILPLKENFAAHGMPETLQSDNKEIQRVSDSAKWKRYTNLDHTIRGPKKKWSGVLRNKISFDMVTQARSDTNRVKNLPNYMKRLNNEKREELGWQSRRLLWERVTS